MAVGTAFEKYALAFLNSSLHMLLRRVGGAGDGGVDLRGEWWVPRPPPKKVPWRAKQRAKFAASGQDAEAADVAEDGAGEERQPDQISGDRASVGPIPPPPPRAVTRHEIVEPPGMTLKGEPNRRKITPIAVWVQCKAAQVVLGPGVVRELDGVLAGRGECAAGAQRAVAAIAMAEGRGAWDSADGRSGRHARRAGIQVGLLAAGAHRGAARDERNHARALAVRLRRCRARSRVLCLLLAHIVRHDLRAAAGRLAARRACGA